MDKIIISMTKARKFDSIQQMQAFQRNRVNAVRSIEDFLSKCDYGQAADFLDAIEEAVNEHIINHSPELLVEGEITENEIA